jgi:hypothetical protein
VRIVAEEKQHYKTVPFSSVQPGSAFYDEDGVLCMKACSNRGFCAVALATGQVTYLDGDDAARPSPDVYVVTPE